MSQGKTPGKIASSRDASSTAHNDPVAALQQLEGALTVGQPLDAGTRGERRSTVRRSSVAQINLVLADAEQNEGVVGGVAFDVTAMRADQSRAARWRVGASAAKEIGVRLADAALLLDASVAQRVLAAVGALESQSKTPEGQALTGKVARLRAAAGPKRKRAPKGAAKGAAATTASTMPVAATHEGTPATPAAPVAPAATSAQEGG